jgi:hypothetical protein
MHGGNGEMKGRYCLICNSWVAGEKLRDCLKKRHAIDWNRGYEIPEKAKVIKEPEKKPNRVVWLVE